MRRPPAALMFLVATFLSAAPVSAPSGVGTTALSGVVIDEDQA